MRRELRLSTIAFFAEPKQSICDWERAIDAQQRIAWGLADVLAPAERDVLVVGHGGVGTLWFCFLNSLAIDKRHDQLGQGHYFSVDQRTRRAEHGWRPSMRSGVRSSFSESAGEHLNQVLHFQFGESELPLVRSLVSLRFNQY